MRSCSRRIELARGGAPQAEAGLLRRDAGGDGGREIGLAALRSPPRRARRRRRSWRRRRSPAPVSASGTASRSRRRSSGSSLSDVSASATMRSRSASRRKAAVTARCRRSAAVRRRPCACCSHTSRPAVRSLRLRQRQQRHVHRVVAVQVGIEDQVGRVAGVRGHRPEIGEQVRVRLGGGVRRRAMHRLAGRDPLLADGLDPHVPALAPGQAVRRELQALADRRVGGGQRRERGVDPLARGLQLARACRRLPHEGIGEPLVIGDGRERRHQAAAGRRCHRARGARTRCPCPGRSASASRPAAA